MDLGGNRKAEEGARHLIRDIPVADRDVLAIHGKRPHAAPAPQIKSPFLLQLLTHQRQEKGFELIQPYCVAYILPRAATRMNLEPKAIDRGETGSGCNCLTKGSHSRFW